MKFKKIYPTYPTHAELKEEELTYKFRNELKYRLQRITVIVNSEEDTEKVCEKVVRLTGHPLPPGDYRKFEGGLVKLVVPYNTKRYWSIVPDEGHIMRDSDGNIFPDFPVLHVDDLFALPDNTTTTEFLSLFYSKTHDEKLLHILTQEFPCLAEQKEKLRQVMIDKNLGFYKPADTEE
jgi:hypothetical protein